MSWGLYDDGKRDYSYHMSVLNKVFLHNLEGYEVLVEEYDPQFNKTKTHTLILYKDTDSVSYIGHIYFAGGIKHIDTFHDQRFLDNWGIGAENVGQPVAYDNAENYEMSINEKKFDVIKISYFDPDGTEDPKDAYLKCF